LTASGSRAIEHADVVFGQYDFEGRTPLNLIVATSRQGEDFVQCGVNIYSLHDNKWKLTGALKADDVVGKCEMEFRASKVTVPRRLRGFYHQLTYQNERFEDTSEF
jgi:hypothetical protein